MRSTPSERQSYIRDWAGSGMSRAAYCREKGLTYSTFMSWFKSVGQEAAEPVFSGRFVALPEDRGQFGEAAPLLEVHFPNGIKLHIHAPLNRSLLKMLSDVGK